MKMRIRKRIRETKIVRAIPLIIGIVGALVGFMYFNKQVVFAAPGVTYVVTNTGDNGGVNPAVGAGTGTLRQAIVDANANAAGTADPNKIAFAITGTGMQTITLASALPQITKPTVIDGTTQAGASCGTLVPAILPASSNAPHTLTVMVTARSIATATSVLNFASTADSSQVKGLILNGALSGNIDFRVGTTAQIMTAAPNFVATCNYLGPDSDGATAISRTSPQNGIGIWATGTNTTISNNLISGNTLLGIGANVSATNIKVYANLVGTDKTGKLNLYNGVTPASGLGSTGISIGSPSGADIYHNIITGNGTTAGGAAVQMTSVNGKVRGNYVGLDMTGMAALPNNYGLRVGGKGIVVGGTTADDRNVVGANTNAGLRLENTDSGVVIGNYFGVGADGVTAFPNGGGGVTLAYLSTNNRVGGATTAERNVISGNTLAGVTIDNNTGCTGNIIEGNYIGLAADGTTKRGNTGNGISVPGLCSNTQIGAAGAGNVVVGSGGHGVVIAGGAATVKGNLIGLTSSNVAMSNTNTGLLINGGAIGTVIGGTGVGDGNVIAGNDATPATAGLNIAGTSANTTVLGNYIGVGTDGTTKLGNGYGIVLSGSPTGVIIGGNTAGARNIISGNTTYGITTIGGTYTGTSNNSIQGNYIGIDKNGDVIPGATGTGVLSGNISGLLIGGSGTGQGNVISGNPIYGVSFSGVVGQNVQVYGNTIGLKPDGETAAGNGVSGIYITGNSSPTGILQIGGASAGQGNIVSGNSSAGITVVNADMTTNPVSIKGNKIGVTASGAAQGNGSNGIRFTGTPGVTGATVGGIGAGEGNIVANNVGNGIVLSSASTRIAVRGNAIYNNTGIGFGANLAPTPNDATTALDADTGPNNLQNYPQRTTLTKCDNSTAQATSLWSVANTTYAIDFYANPSGTDPTGYGEGEQYVSSTTVTTNAAGYASISSPAGIVNMSMTATDPNGNTSEFSGERAVSISGCAVTSKVTNDTTPPLAGTVTLTGFSAGDTPSSASLEINGQNVNAPITSPNWALADNTLTALANSSYTVDATVTDPVSKLSASFTGTNALTIDTIKPTVTINQAMSQADPTNINSAKFDITFSEDVATLAAADLTLTGTSGTVTTLTKVDNSHYTATVTGMTNGDTVTASLPANIVTDDAGNQNTSSVSTDNQVTYDTTKPTVTINQAAGQADPTDVNNANFTVTFSKPVTGLVASGIKITGSSSAFVGSITAVSSTVYTVSIVNMTNGDNIAVSVNADTATDAAGNTSTASTSTDNSVTYDNTSPVVVVESTMTNNTSPQIIGTVNDPLATIIVTIDGHDYTATNNGDGTWSLPAGTISPALTDGQYDVTVKATDPAGNVGIATSISAVTIDTLAPTGTVAAVAPSITNSPELTGTVNDPSATIIVTIDSYDYPAINNGDGTWTLAAGQIAPALSVGDHPVTVTFKDPAGNTSSQQTTISVLRPDADLPTVNPVDWIGGTPIITGTYDAANSQSLTVTVNGVGYVLGAATQLSVHGNTWKLDLSALSPALPAGTYDVTVKVTTRSGAVLGDSTITELKIITPTIANVIANPGAGLANTGTAIWKIETMAAMLILLGCISYKVLRQKDRKKFSKP